MNMQRSMSLRIYLLLFFAFFIYHAHGQLPDSLSQLIKVIQKGSNDSIRLEANKKFTDTLEKILLQKGSFEENFDSLKNVSVQTPEDKKFRIYTWVVPHFDGSEYDYYGFIQIHTDTSYKLIRLNDSTSTIKKAESEKLLPEKWLGAIYYEIVPVKKSGKIYYTLLGWKGKNEKETQKVIEILYFNGTQPKFGYPLIKTGSVFRNRMIFTFSAWISMTLRYDKKYGGIVFDHLSVNKNNPESLAGPDGTYDILKIKKDKWEMFEDVKVGVKINEK
jgi:hypothetical protein